MREELIIINSYIINLLIKEDIHKLNIMNYHITNQKTKIIMIKIKIETLKFNFNKRIKILLISINKFSFKLQILMEIIEPIKMKETIKQ